MQVRCASKWSCRQLRLLAGVAAAHAVTSAVLLGALAAGAGVAYALHLLRPVVSSSRSISALTELPILGDGWHGLPDHAPRQGPRPRVAGCHRCKLSAAGIFPGAGAQLVWRAAEFPAGCARDYRDVSLVEQAIAKLRQAAGPGKTMDRVPAVPMARVMTVASENLEHTAKNNRVLAIDSAAMRTHGYLPESAVDRQFAEHFRQIKRPLVEKALSAHSRADEADARVVMITSALPGEGKTFTSINLALSMARERDMSVLLVDADILKPHVSEIFGIKHDPGLMDALMDEKISIESVVLATNVKGLSVLPAGRMADGAAELLVSNRMRQILRRLVTENPRRIVLLDSPPLLATSEGRALTKVAGQVALVVRAEHTLQEAVKSALEHIDPTRMAGIILNDARLSLTESLYGYGSYGS